MILNESIVFQGMLFAASRNRIEPKIKPGDTPAFNSTQYDCSVQTKCLNTHIQYLSSEQCGCQWSVSNSYLLFNSCFCSESDPCNPYVLLSTFIIFLCHLPIKPLHGRISRRHLRTLFILYNKPRLILFA